MQDVWKIHCKKMESYGFDRLIYGISHFMTPNSMGPREDVMTLSSHDPEYMEHYYGLELYRSSPMLLWASENTGSCSWSWVHKNMDAMDEGNRKVLELNRQMGVTAGYTISFQEASRRKKSIIALTAKRGLSQEAVDAIWREHGDEIEALNNIAHLKIISLPLSTERSQLSKRQREVLEWVGDGKTNQDIATILGVTSATVEKHLRIARDKLGVDTSAQAVLKMSFLNQIFTPDE
ncbi:LuxR family transcriptional regulator [Aliiroseovarius sp. F20344]|uniref:helix-turn-helix transcriptional regulator n=1 Tax=Aliiroseovarius sp. F20344 TaxID=2926414 RepID=UPI001FF1D9B7|nr:LuxR family transcriptional regulator [Aliiroseovarius sp. F20344]MCK0143612.1 LuxR family transcriptional regulator [Aliiroseovarius sp. F20344]